MKKISILMLLTALWATAAKPVKTSFKVEPPMFCSNCENRIKGDLRFERGVKGIETNLDTQRVTISYDPAKTDTVVLKKAFAKIGYNASVVADSVR